MKPGKLIAMGGLLLLVVFAGWEAKRFFSPAIESVPIQPLPSAAPPVVAPPPPIPVQPPPPVKTAAKPPPKKTVVPKKPAPVMVAPKPIIPAITPPPTPAFVPPPPPSAPLEWQGNDTSVTHVGQIVIHNDHQWVHFWSEHHPHEAAPEIDFTQNMVVGVFAGPRPAEQFTISIQNARPVSGSLVVDYREKLPPPGTFAVNVTVYPYHIKVIPQSKLPVKFNMLQPEGVVR